MHYIVSFYAALFAILYLFLNFKVIRLRWILQTSLGDGGHPHLQRAIRAHANFAEFVPLFLILLYFVESADFPVLLVHCLCAAFLCARISHAYGISQVQETLIFRMSGMIITFSVISIASALLLHTGYTNLR